jgi:hypothetical protein
LSSWSFIKASGLTALGVGIMTMRRNLALREGVAWADMALRSERGVVNRVRRGYVKAVGETVTV